MILDPKKCRIPVIPQYRIFFYLDLLYIQSLLTDPTDHSKVCHAMLAARMWSNLKKKIKHFAKTASSASACDGDWWNIIVLSDTYHSYLQPCLRVTISVLFIVFTKQPLNYSMSSISVWTLDKVQVEYNASDAPHRPVQPDSMLSFKHNPFNYAKKTKKKNIIQSTNFHFTILSYKV